MRFKVDENLPPHLVELLRDHGHDAVTVRAQGLAGRADERIAAVCRDEQRAIVTLDDDFADIRRYPPSQYAGLIVIRLQLHSRGHIMSVAQRLAPLLKREPLAGHLWIVEENGVRIRTGDEA